jgi:hypothetical protein
MNLSEQVCSLELAKKLLTLGVKQNSYFSCLKLTCQYEVWPTNYLNNRECAAFTVAELMNILPILNGMPCELIKIADLRKGLYYCCRYWNDIENTHAEATNAADACAKMLIYLIENGLYEP